MNEIDDEIDLSKFKVAHKEAPGIVETNVFVEEGQSNFPPAYKKYLYIALIVLLVAASIIVLKYLYFVPLSPAITSGNIQPDGKLFPVGIPTLPINTR